MALITCAECGREISDLAASCVNCGAPVSVTIQAPDQESTPKPVSTAKADLAQKPMFWLLSAVMAVGAAWTGVYGFGALTNPACQYLWFNRAEGTTFDRAFLCVDENKKIHLTNTLVPGPYYPHAAFAFVMIVLSIGFLALTWLMARRARAAT